MKVELIAATPEADVILLFTKNTRLNMTPGLLNEIRGWSPEKKAADLAYMAGTIRSSWEFVDLTFLLSGVSRAAAQQITRTRTASYAMQSQRVTDVSSMGVVVPHGLTSEQADAYENGCRDAKAAYRDLVALGVPLEDARGVLPINTECNLVVKYNLRSFVDVVAARSSLRAQGEYADGVRQMKAQALAVWPWSAPFFESPYQTAIEMLEAVAKELGITPGRGPAWQIAKAIDLLRKG